MFIGAFEVPSTPPTLAAVGVTRQAGLAVSSSASGTAGDAETAVNALTMTVNGERYR